MKAVELLGCHGVDELEDEFLGLEMARAVEVQAAPRGGRRVAHG